MSKNYGCWQLPLWKTSSQNEHYDPMTSREKKKQNKTVHVANNKICILGQNWKLGKSWSG